MFCKNVGGEGHEPSHAVDQAFQLLDIETLLLSPTLRVQSAWHGKSGNQIRYTKLRVYLTYKRASSKPQVRETVTQSWARSRWEQRFRPVHIRYCRSKRKMEICSLTTHQNYIHQHGWKESARKIVWSQHRPPNAINTVYGLVYQSRTDILAVYTFHHKTLKDTYEWERRWIAPYY